MWGDQIWEVTKKRAKNEKKRNLRDNNLIRIRVFYERRVGEASVAATWCCSRHLLSVTSILSAQHQYIYIYIHVYGQMWEKIELRNSLKICFFFLSLMQMSKTFFLKNLINDSNTKVEVLLLLFSWFLFYFW